MAGSSRRAGVYSHRSGTLIPTSMRSPAPRGYGQSVRTGRSPDAGRCRPGVFQAAFSVFFPFGVLVFGRRRATPVFIQNQTFGNLFAFTPRLPATLNHSCLYQPLSGVWNRKGRILCGTHGNFSGTIRSHIKHIFAKDCLLRQVKPVRLVLSLAGVPESRNRRRDQPQACADLVRLY